MKRVLMATIALALLAGCAPANTAAPTTSPTKRSTPKKKATVRAIGKIQVRIHHEDDPALFINGVCAFVYRASDGKQIATSKDKAQPVFKLPDGRYKVMMQSCGKLEGQREVEWWKDSATRAGARIVTVKRGKTVDVTGRLAASAFISGYIIDGSGLAAEGACAFAHFPNKERAISIGKTKKDGTYQIRELAASTYRVSFDDCPGMGNRFARSWFGGSSFAKAKALALRPRAAKRAINGAVTEN